MQSIIKLFSDHGTFVMPDALTYIFSKEKPDDFAAFLIKNLREYPLFLALDIIKDIEDSTQELTETPMTIPPQTPASPLPPVEKTIEKEFQKKMLSKIYSKPSFPKEINEEEDEEDTEEEQPQQEEKKPLQPLDIKTVKSWKPIARDYDSEVRIITDITGKRTSEGTTQDFVNLFRDRYQGIRKILTTQRREIAQFIPINRIKKTMVDVQLIGIVKNVKTTHNGHRLIEIEDETGSATLMALKSNTEIMQLANEVMFDEVIGVVGKISKNKDLIIVQNIIFPDIKMHQDRKRIEPPLCVAFLSDIHIGSKMFMDAEWNAFLRWINGDLGNSRQRDVANKLKYLVVPGDLVDGIGIYPNQEKELSISNIYDQYKALAKHFEYIPDHVTILLQPGNHDAVRPAEPQPAFEKEIRDLFSGKEFIFIGNPSYFSLHGVNILSYHGQSLLDYSTNIQYLNYNQPTEVMKLMLKKRHLAPTYGGYTPLAPEHEDYMLINQVPDIFVTGHVHTLSIDNYRGVILINASSWQSQTSYQKMMNFVPDSAKLPLVDLKTGNATSMDFSKTST
ncbi:MAG: DNA-directed DNA polymerase II small subunit [Euryarchaeota archaeon]|nr:DNA-directed DNA polymerase II small subunit [Euryarchaeota archaeon]